MQEEQAEKRSEPILNTKEQEKCSHCDEYLAGWKRARADYENLKREMESREKMLGQFMNMRLLLEILPVVNHFKLALRFVPDVIKNDPWYKGIEGIRNALQKFLKDQGVEEMKTVGEKFDPELHESLGEIQADLDGIITEELESGFLLHGKVLQSAKVKIGKKILASTDKKGGETL